MVYTALNTIGGLIEEVAPKIEKLTMWDCHVDGLTAKIISPDEFWGYEIIVFESMGINTAPKTEKGKIAFERLKTISTLSAGMYLPTNSILLISKNTLMKNPDVQAVILGHEIVHRCQDVNNPSFVKNWVALFKSFGTNAFDDNLFENENFRKCHSGYNDLVESDAAHVTNQLIWNFYTLADCRYTIGDNQINILEDIQKKDGRAGINRLYGLSLTELYDLFNLSSIKDKQ